MADQHDLGSLFYSIWQKRHVYAEEYLNWGETKPNIEKIIEIQV